MLSVTVYMYWYHMPCTDSLKIIPFMEDITDEIQEKTMSENIGIRSNAANVEE